MARELWDYTKAARSIDDIRNVIGAGIKINSKDTFGNTALHYCSEYDTETGLVIVKMLIENGAKVNIENLIGQTPLIKFVLDKCNIEYIRLLCNSGANVNHQDQFGNTVLHYLSGYESCKASSDILELLIQNMVSGYESSKALDILELLIQNKVDINMKNFSGKTPLMYFIDAQSSNNIIKSLINHGADIHCVDLEGNTALDHCSGYADNDLETVKLLIGSEIDINHKNSQNETAIIKFLWFRFNTDIMKALLIAGADCRDSFCQTLFGFYNPNYNIYDVTLLFTYTVLFDENIWNVYSALIQDYIIEHDYDIDFSQLKNAVTKSIDEIPKLKDYSIRGNFTLYDLCKEKNNRKLSVYYKNYYKNLDLEVLKTSFPNYFDLIEFKMDCGKQWFEILRQLQNICLSNRLSNPTEISEVHLNADCVMYISSYLCKRDLINLINSKSK